MNDDESGDDEDCEFFVKKVKSLKGLNSEIPLGEINTRPLELLINSDREIFN